MRLSEKKRYKEEIVGRLKNLCGYINNIDEYIDKVQYLQSEEEIRKLADIELMESYVEYVKGLGIEEREDIEVKSGDIERDKLVGRVRDLYKKSIEDRQIESDIEYSEDRYEEESYNYEEPEEEELDINFGGFGEDIEEFNRGIELGEEGDKYQYDDEDDPWSEENDAYGNGLEVGGEEVEHFYRGEEYEDVQGNSKVEKKEYHIYGDESTDKMYSRIANFSARSCSVIKDVAKTVVKKVEEMDKGR